MDERKVDDNADAVLVAGIDKAHQHFRSTVARGCAVILRHLIAP